MIFRKSTAIFALLFGTPAISASDAFVDGKPEFFPGDIPSPLAYYYLDDGEGSDLMESVSNDPKGGEVIADADHQTNFLSPYKPNWVKDVNFGRTIKCGLMDKVIGVDVVQKDTLSLKDVDYGKGGSWAWSVWFRHDIRDFADTAREQFIGHGDPANVMTSRNQVNLQFERNGIIRTHLYDSNDIDRFNLDSSDPLCHESQECRLPAVAYSETTTQYYNDREWHHLVLTTNPGGGKGYNVYVDGLLRSSSPYSNVGTYLGFEDCAIYKNCAGVGGDEINPVGPIRLCGRAKPDNWKGAKEGEYAWDPKRYFHGQVAHFAIFDSPLSDVQLENLRNAYIEEYDIYSSKLPTGILVGIICSAVASAALATLVWKCTKKESLSKNQESMEFA